MSSVEPMSFKITEEDIKEERFKEQIENGNSKFLERSLKLGKLSLFFISLTLLVFVGILAETILFANELFEVSQFVGYLYIALFSLVLYLISYFLYFEVAKFLQMKKVDELKELAEKNPVSFGKHVLDIYGNRKEESIQTNIANFQTSFPNLSSEMIVPVLDSTLFTNLDREAEEIIFKYAKENAMVTAISPIPFFDFLFLTWRNIRMVNEIVEVYGFRAGFLGNIILLKRVLEQLIFVGVAEVTEEAIGTVTGQTFLSKISSSVAEGVGHGILTVRVGTATMRTSRPIEKREIKLIGKFIKSFSPFKKKK